MNPFPQVRFAMTMREVNRIVKYKPYLIFTENLFRQETGKTIWSYSLTINSVEIYFQDSYYIAHEVTPTLFYYNRGYPIEIYIGEILLTGLDEKEMFSKLIHWID